MSHQLESRHFLQPGDRVQRLDGRTGSVADAFALYAVVEWDEEGRQEVDQLDPTVWVTERAAKE
jgi:hypothetical protein